MTDELTRLREALQASEPGERSRTAGIDSALAAFDAEFDQGAESARDASGQAPPAPLPRRSRRAAPVSRRPWYRPFSRAGMVVGGGAVAAALAAFIVVPNIKDDDLTDRLSRSPIEDRSASIAGASAADAEDTPESDRETLGLQQAPPPAPEATALQPMAAPAPVQPLSDDVSAYAGASRPAPAEAMPSDTTAGLLKRRDTLAKTQTESRSAVSALAEEPTFLAPPSPADLDALSEGEAPESELEDRATPSDANAYRALRAALDRGEVPQASSIDAAALIRHFTASDPEPKRARQQQSATLTIVPAPWDPATLLAIAPTSPADLTVDPAVIRQVQRLGTDTAEPSGTAIYTLTPADTADLSATSLATLISGDDQTPTVARLAAFDETDADTRFAVAVAAFILKLQGDAALASYDFDSIARLASEAADAPSPPRRAAFIETVIRAKNVVNPR